MRFEEFWLTLDDVGRNDLRDAWQKWAEVLKAASGVHLQFAINVEAERLLPSDACESLRRVILPVAGSVNDL